MKSKYDKDYQRFILENGIDRDYLKRKKEIYEEYLKDNNLEWYFRHSESLKTIEPFDCASRLLASRRSKNAKVRKKIESLVLENNAIFITLTFSDDVLKNTSFETRRRYVARYLKSKAKKYVANVDYGKKNGREHYHAVVDASFVIEKKWAYGFEDAERIGSTLKYAKRTKEENLLATTRYITKLTHHALKNGYDMPRLIYSRNTL